MAQQQQNQDYISPQQLIEHLFHTEVEQKDIVKCLESMAIGDWYVFNNPRDYDTDDSDDSDDSEEKQDDNFNIQFAYIIKDEYVLEMLKDFEYMLIYQYKGTYWYIKESYGCSLGRHIESCGLYRHVLDKLDGYGASFHLN